MATEVKSQPIAGVSAGHECQIETVYPSIAASGIGRGLGTICDSIPLKIGGIKLSYLLFGPLVAPFALIGYFMRLLTGQKYVVTNRNVQVWSTMGNRMLRQIPLTDIADVVVYQQAGQAFYHAGDVHLLNNKEQSILKLPGVKRPERFRHVLLSVRDARLKSDASLKAIQSRKPA